MKAGDNVQMSKIKMRNYQTVFSFLLLLCLLVLMRSDEAKLEQREIWAVAQEQLCSGENC